MPSNYKRLGDYIQEVNIRNRDLSNIPLLGVSIKKVLMPSIANIIGTDMSTYKLIKKNQFAYGPVTSRNGDKISIALLEEYDNAMVSQAYTVFKVIDENELLPEYLMMWFRRPEFDRYARFMSHGSAREIFSWTEMCETLLPIPTLEKQQEIVREYNTIQNRIALNNQLISKLEETAQAIYKQWFVDFEFPNDNGKPYKSNGGKMLESELGEIPEDWEVINLSKYCDFINGYSYKGDELKQSKTAMISIKNFDKNGGFKTEGLKEIIPDKIRLNCHINVGEVLVAHTDLTQGIIIGNPIIVMNKSVYDNLIFSMDTVKVLSLKKEISNCLLYSLLKDKRFKEFSLGFVNGSTVMHLSKSALLDYKIYLPNNLNLIKQLSFKLDKVLNYQINLHNDIEKLQELKDLLLAKMTRVENFIKKHKL